MDPRRAPGGTTVSGAVALPVRPTTKRLMNVLLLVLVTGAIVFWFWAYIQASGVSPDRPQLFSDAIRYLAAAERLNAGHSLYELVPGDRPVLTIPGVHDAPLLSPPPIAVVWRLIVAVPFGFATWMIAAGVALFTAVAIVVLRSPLPGAPLAFALSLPLGEAIFGGNSVVFYPLLYIVAWRYREHAWVGAVIAVMAADKLGPIALASWLLGARRMRPLIAGAVTLTILFVIGSVGAGYNAYLEWFRVLGSIGPSPLGLSGLTGVPWASYAVLVVGVTVALLVGRRRESAAFVAALLAAVLGNPALYPGHLAALLAMVAPLVYPAPVDQGVAERRPWTGPRVWRAAVRPR